MLKFIQPELLFIKTNADPTRSGNRSNPRSESARNNNPEPVWVWLKPEPMQKTNLWAGCPLIFYFNCDVILMLYLLNHFREIIKHLPHYQTLLITIIRTFLKCPETILCEIVWMQDSVFFPRPFFAASFSFNCSHSLQIFPGCFDF